MSEPGFPTRFPIFPLPNVVLFPETVLPLHVFEPRYCALAEHAVGADRVIGMVLVEPEADAMAARAPIFAVGCAGRMSEIEALDDGRFNFLLTGTRRFSIVSEALDPTGFRLANTELWADPEFARLPADERTSLEAGRDDLEQRVLALVQLQSPDDVESLGERLGAFDPLQLVRALSFGLNSEPVAKQRVLEAHSPREQLALLGQLVDFLIAEARLPEGPRTLN